MGHSLSAPNAMAEVSDALYGIQIRYEDYLTLVKYICSTNTAGICVRSKDGFKILTASPTYENSSTLLNSLFELNTTTGLLCIENVNDDPRLHNITQNPEIIAYCGMTITDDSQKVIALLFTFDHKPLKISDAQLELLKTQARQLQREIRSGGRQEDFEQTKRKLASMKSRLDSHEEQYQSILDSSGDMMFELDANGMFISINRQLKDALGYSDEEFASMHYTSLVVKHKQRKFKAFFEDQLDPNNKNHYAEFPLESKDRNSKWVGLKVAIKYSNNQHWKFVVVARDISKEKEVTNKLSKYRNGLKLINEIASNVNFTLKEQLYMALEVGSSYLGLEVAVIGQIIEDTYHVRYSQLAHPEYGVELKGSYKLKDVLSEITFKQDDVVSISYIKESKYASHPCYEALEMEAYIGTPYYIKGKREGTVSFFSLTPRNAPFDDNEIDFIKIFARWIGFILERERNQNSLLSEQGMLRAFASFSPAPIAMFNKDMEYLAATEKWLAENGLDANEIIGRNHYEIFPEIKEEWKESYERALKGEVLSRAQDWYIDKNGKKVWLSWEVRPWYTEEHEIGGIILFTQNITLQKNQAEELVRAKEAAEKASHAKDQFLSTMSHEIRTPLNAVIGAGHLLLQEDPREDQIENLTLLKNSGEHLLSLVNDVLDFNKIEEGQLRLEEISFDFHKLISSIQFAMTQSANEKNIQFMLEVDDNIPPILKGDPTRINQILINLASNAIKFTEKGQVQLTVKLQSIENKFIRLYLEVKDSGIGISEEKLKSVFERFTQADEDTTRKYGGSGLGLTITRKLLEMMGSEIRATSIPGEGSRFYFELTLMKGNKSQVVPEKIKKEKKGIKAVTSKRILLVDDHEVNRVMASKFLSKWGFIVDCAVNGKDCLEKVESKSYDLILMDLQMPEMDGFEATNFIRARKERYFKNLPIIALTASALVETREEVKRVGMNDYVTKPFNPKIFRNKLAMHLNNPPLAE